MMLKPVFACRVCGRPAVIGSLKTLRSDADGQLLHELMSGLGRIALCDFHRRQRRYYVEQGRAEEWEAMAAREGRLLTVRDERTEHAE